MSDVIQDIHKAPLLRVAIPFMAGIVIAHVTPLPKLWWGVVTAVSLLLLIWVYHNLKWYHLRHIFGLSLIIFSMMSGGGLYLIHQENNKPDHIPIDARFTGYVSSLPQEKEKSVLVEFTICGADHNLLDKPMVTWIYIEKSIPDSIIQPGSWLLIDAQLKVPHKNELTTEFDFYEYLLGQNIHYTAYVPHSRVQQMSVARHRNLKIAGLSIKNRVLQIFNENNINGQELALVSALTIGYKKLLPAEQREAYAASGAMHVLAVSGLHVGILFVLLSFLFGFVKKLPVGELLFTAIVILLLFCFAFITGFSPSVTRATVMFSFIAVGKALHRQQYIINTIAASALFILLINPTLLFKIGFQLSYVAVTGIVLFYPILSARFKASRKVTRWLLGLVLVSVVAQLVTAPLNLFYFHRFANYSILANLLVIPLVTVLLNLTILLVIAGFVGVHIPFLGDVINGLAKAMNGGVYFISSIPGSTFESIYLTSTECLMLFAILISVLILFYYQKKVGVWMMLALAVLFSTSRTMHKYKHWSDSRLVVYQDFGTTRVLVKGQNQGLVIVPSQPDQVAYCPVWFYRYHVHENNVLPVLYTENIAADKFCLYRQFLIFKEGAAVYIGKNADTQLRDSALVPLANTVIQLKNKANWQVAHFEFNEDLKSNLKKNLKRGKNPVYYQFGEDNGEYNMLFD